MQITFLGATKTVTGSRFLLTTPHCKILVDCGLFQGLKELRLRNWETFPIAPSSINCVILTHAHIDHSGYLPLLIKNGFTGNVYCTKATKDFCKILLPDSGYLQEEEARFANKHGFSKHKPALPLYTREDAEKSLAYLKAIPFNQPIALDAQTSFTFIPAGHILGSGFVSLEHAGKKVLFSGDLGRPDDPIMPAPSRIHSSDYLVLESTYGNRLHEKGNPLDEIALLINQTINRGGTIIIPAFAVGRAQHMLYFIYLLKQAKRIPPIPIYMDSPMAKSATQVFYQYAHELRLSTELADAVCKTAFYIDTKIESQALDADSKPKVIISASGMLEGGRVLHHIKMFAPDPKNTIVFAGYQAAGTRGEALVNGKTEIKMFGQIIPIRAQIKLLSNISAHADYQEILGWLKQFQRPPHKVFITHGEAPSAENLKKLIETDLGWRCHIPDYLYHERL